ncbi:Bile acid 7-alpha dehydratase [compost metagenome]
MFINLDKQTLLNGSAIYEDSYIKIQGEWRILRTGYKRLLEIIGPLDPQWSITSQPIN